MKHVRTSQPHQPAAEQQPSAPQPAEKHLEESGQHVPQHHVGIVKKTKTKTQKQKQLSVALTNTSLPKPVNKTTTKTKRSKKPKDDSHNEDDDDDADEKLAMGLWPAAVDYDRASCIDAYFDRWALAHWLHDKFPLYDL